MQQDDVPKLELCCAFPYNAARRGPIHPPSGRASLVSGFATPKYAQPQPWNSSVEREEYLLESSERIILECGCGERLILLGLEEDWRSEQRTEFDCSCGKGLTISINWLNEDVLDFRRLMRGAFKSRAVDDSGL